MNQSFLLNFGDFIISIMNFINYSIIVFSLIKLSIHKSNEYSGPKIDISSQRN